MFVDVSVRDDPGNVVFEDWLGGRCAALLRFAFLVTGSQEAAEEAVQTALTRAFERWSWVSRTRDPDAYVRRMVVNAHVSRWRRSGRREVPVAQVHDRTGARDVGDQVAVAETVRRACATLPVRQRAAVVLRYFEDRSFADVAAILGCREATARSHVHRGLAALRAELERQEAPDD